MPCASGPRPARDGRQIASSGSTGSTGSTGTGENRPQTVPAPEAPSPDASRRAGTTGPSAAPSDTALASADAPAETPSAGIPRRTALPCAAAPPGDPLHGTEAAGVAATERQAAGIRGAPAAVREEEADADRVHGTPGGGLRGTETAGLAAAGWQASVLEEGADAEGFFGLAALDRLFPAGFPAASLHEIAADAARDGGLSTAFALATVRRWLEGGSGPGAVLWVSERLAATESGGIHGPGCLALGFDPRRLVLVEAHGARDVLWAMEEGLSAGGAAAVVGEVRGEPRALDLTASRRLALRSERYGVPALLLRNAGGAGASAARTRWRIAPAPGRGTAPPVPGVPDDAFAGGAGGLPPMGLPVWRIDVVRNREGRCAGTLAGFDPVRARFFAPSVRHVRSTPSTGGPVGTVLPFPALRSASASR